MQTLSSMKDGNLKQRYANYVLQCAQIRVTGSGTNSGSNTVSFPGAYTASHPGITVSIYDNKGSPYPSSYQIPGPAPITCSGGSSGGGGSNSGGGSNNGGGSSQQPSTGEGAALYAQCGGTGWTGPTTCKEGTCKASGDFYSQCVP